MSLAVLEEKPFGYLLLPFGSASHRIISCRPLILDRRSFKLGPIPETKTSGDTNCNYVRGAMAPRSTAAPDGDAVKSVSAQDGHPPVLFTCRPVTATTLHGVLFCRSANPSPIAGLSNPRLYPRPRGATPIPILASLDPPTRSIAPPRLYCHTTEQLVQWPLARRSHLPSHYPCTCEVFTSCPLLHPFHFLYNIDFPLGNNHSDCRVRIGGWVLCRTRQAHGCHCHRLPCCLGYRLVFGGIPQPHRSASDL